MPRTKQSGMSKQERRRRALLAQKKAQHDKWLSERARSKGDAGGGSGGTSSGITGTAVQRTPRSAGGRSRGSPSQHHLRPAVRTSSSSGAPPQHQHGRESRYDGAQGGAQYGRRSSGGPPQHHAAAGGGGGGGGGGGAAASGGHGGYGGPRDSYTSSSMYETTTLDQSQQGHGHGVTAQGGGAPGGGHGGGQYPEHVSSGFSRVRPCCCQVQHGVRRLCAALSARRRRWRARP